jgi:hypothetical protein
MNWPSITEIFRYAWTMAYILCNYTQCRASIKRRDTSVPERSHAAPNSTDNHKKEPRQMAYILAGTPLTAGR